MNAEYHALSGGAEEVDETGDAVWDQLNDAQSREVQQHESRFQNADPFGRGNPLSIAWSMAHHTASSATDALMQTAQRARIAAREWHEKNNINTVYYDYSDRQRGRWGTQNNQYHQPHTEEPGDEFDLQFGIQDLWRRGEESTLASDATTKNYINNGDFRNEPAFPGDKPTEESEEEKQRPLHGYPFVVLQEGRGDVPNRNDYHHHLTSERDRWGMIGNLDVFLTHLYKYYYHRGLTPMLCSFLVETICLLFTIWLTRLLLVGVDWRKLWAMDCNEDPIENQDNSTNICYTDLGDYARTDPLDWTSYLLIQGYTGLLLSYAFFQMYVFHQDFFGYAIQCRTILHEKLGLSERKLQGGALSWNDVVTKLVEGQETGSFRIIHHHQQNQSNNTDIPSIPHKTPGKGPAAPPSAAFNLPKNPSKLNEKQSILDPLQIAQRIMRKENFMLAFWNAGILDCTKIGQRHYWCGAMEWSFYQCVLNFMFNHKYELRPAFCLDADALKRRLKVCGIVHLCLLPFLLVFMVLSFFLRHVFDYSRNKASSSGDGNSGGGLMGHPQWSSAATWIFREFNELPHAFEKRMEPSYKNAVEYCGLFGTSEYLIALGRLLVFFSGTVGGILVVLGGVMGADFLIHVHLWGRNLVWYAGIAGATYSVGKTLEPTKEATPSVSKNLFENMDAALKRVSQHTHYYPEHWKGRGWDPSVYSSFKTLFDSEVKLFLYELAALILTPYILYFRVSGKADAICEFCLISKAKLVLTANSGLIAGDVCGFSTFDFDIFGDEAWEGRTLGRSAILERERQQHGAESLTESILRTGNLDDATRLHPKPKARHGKMEKSFFTFQAEHPDWERCFPPSGKSLVSRVDEYRKSTERSLITRERELHVQAAVRQLETLARIEEKESHYIPNQYSNHGAELLTNARQNQSNSVISRNTPAADAGAGSHSDVLFSEGNEKKQERKQLAEGLSSMKPEMPSLFNSRSSKQDVIRPYSNDVLKPVDCDSREYASESPLPFSPPPTSIPMNQPKVDTNHRDRMNQDTPNDLLPIEASQSQTNMPSYSTARKDHPTANFYSTQTDHIFSMDRTTLSPLLDRELPNEYNWLERFHEHLEKQKGDAVQQQQRSSNQPFQESSTLYDTQLQQEEADEDDRVEQTIYDGSKKTRIEQCRYNSK